MGWCQWLVWIPGSPGMATTSPKFDRGGSSLDCPCPRCACCCAAKIWKDEHGWTLKDIGLNDLWYVLHIVQTSLVVAFSEEFLKYDVRYHLLSYACRTIFNISVGAVGDWEKVLRQNCSLFWNSGRSLRATFKSAYKWTSRNLARKDWKRNAVRLDLYIICIYI